MGNHAHKGSYTGGSETEGHNPTEIIIDPIPPEGGSGVPHIRKKVEIEDIEGQISEIQNADYRLGICVGYEEISSYLLKLSGDCFSRGDDKEAELHRNLSKDINEKAIKLRKTYEEFLRPCKDSAFTEIELILKG